MIYIYKPRSDWRKRSDLTPGEQYDCECHNKLIGELVPRLFYSSDGIYYRLVSDLGKVIEVHESHFIRLDDWREDKLKELGL
jgi:hypothetical protein